MKATLSRLLPHWRKGDGAEQEPQDEDPTPHDADSEATHGDSRRTYSIASGGFATSSITRAFQVLLILGLLAGPIALAVSLRPATVSPTQPSSTPSTHSSDADRAGSTALLLVRTWLTASADDIDRVADLVAISPAAIELPDKRPEPPDFVELVQAREARTGEWVVVVAAGGGLAGDRSAYRVLIQTTANAAWAVALPAKAPLPATQPPPTAVEDGHDVPLNDPVTDTLAGFAAALLAGQGDISRWISPDSELQALPTSCQSVDVQQVLTASDWAEPTEAAEITVLATLTCRTAKAAKGHPALNQTLQYPLVLRVRASRWEVVKYATAPPRAEPHPPSPEGQQTQPDPTPGSASPR